MAGTSVLAKMAVQISANNAQFATALSKSQRDLSAFKSGVLKIAGALGVAFSINQVAAFGLEISKLSGQADGVKAAFERLPNSTKLMDELKQATGGTVSELALMKRAVQASNFDIELSQLPKLLEFATLRAQQTGQSVDYLVDSIVTGIGRKSKLILDNLGISAVQLTEALGGASAASASIADVTKAVGTIADSNLKNMAKFSENAATKAERLAATWENVKVALGNETKGAVGGFFDLASGILTDINESLTNQVTALEREKTSLNTLVGAIQDTVEGEKARKILLDELNTKYPNFLKNLDAEKVTNEQLAARLKDVNAQFERKILLAAAEGRQKDVADQILDAIDDEITARKALIATQEAMGREQGYNAILAARAEGLEGAIANAIERRIRLQGDLEESITAYNNALQIFTTSTGDYFTQTNNQAKTLNSTLETLSQTAQRAIAGVGPSGVIGQSGLGFVPVDTAAIEARMKSLGSTSATVTEEIGQNWVDLSGIAGGAITDIAYSLGEIIAGTNAEFEQAKARLASLTEGTEEYKHALQAVEDARPNFGKNMVKTLAMFAGQVGEILIGIGTAMLAAKKAINNPYTAIAAGVALVALAGAMSAKANSAQVNFNSGGGSSGGRTNGADRFTANTGVQDSVPQLVTVLKGEDVWIMLQNYQSGNRYTSG